MESKENAQPSPRKTRKSEAVITFRADRHGLRSVDTRRAELGMNRSEYIRFLVNLDCGADL